MLTWKLSLRIIKIRVNNVFLGDFISNSTDHSSDNNDIPIRLFTDPCKDQNLVNKKSIIDINFHSEGASWKSLWSLKTSTASWVYNMNIWNMTTLFILHKTEYEKYDEAQPTEFRFVLNSHTVKRACIKKKEPSPNVYVFMI